MNSDSPGAGTAPGLFRDCFQNQQTFWPTGHSLTVTYFSLDTASPRASVTSSRSAGQLVCLTVYKRGAEEVVRRLTG